MKLKRIPYIYHLDGRCHTCISPQREFVEALYWQNISLPEIVERAQKHGFEVGIQGLKAHLSKHALFVHEIELEEKRIDYAREIEAHKRIIDNIKGRLESGEQKRGDVEDLSKLWKVIGDLERIGREEEKQVNVSLLIPPALRLISDILPQNEITKSCLKVREWLASEEARIREGAD